MEPTAFEDEWGQIIKATVAAFGDTRIRSSSAQLTLAHSLPNFRTIEKQVTCGNRPGVLAIDHIAVGVQQGEIDYWVDYYNERWLSPINGRRHCNEYSAMNFQSRAKPLRSHNNCNRRACSPAKRKSPIDEYLTYYAAPAYIMWPFSQKISSRRSARFALTASNLRARQALTMILSKLA